MARSIPTASSRHVIRQLMLRQTAILNHVNPFRALFHTQGEAMLKTVFAALALLLSVSAAPAQESTADDVSHQVRHLLGHIAARGRRI